MELILASQSPYRKNLLRRLNIPFLVQSSHVDEAFLKKTLHGKSPQDLAMALSLAKATHVKSQYPKACVIGSDQLLFCNDKIYGKSGNNEKAKNQLLELQGKTHLLITAVTVLSPSSEKTWFVQAKMKLRQLDEVQIENYLQIDRPYDCAGSYKLELRGIGLFDSIDCQDWTSIEGLPLLSLSKELKKLNLGS